VLEDRRETVTRSGVHRDHPAQRRHARGQTFGDGGPGGELIVTKTDQQSLELMGQLADRRAADRVGGALERMQAAQQRGHRLGIGRRLVERRHRACDHVEVLGCLRPEVRQDVAVRGDEPVHLLHDAPGVVRADRRRR